MDISLCRDSTLASPTPEKRHWEFPCLEIPEAPLQHGGAPLRSSLSRDLRGSYTPRRRFTCSCTTWGSTTSSVCKKSTYICSNLLERLWGSTTSFCVKEVDLHLFKPLGQVYKFSLLKYNGAILPTGVGLLDSLQYKFLWRRLSLQIKSEDAFTFGTDLVETDLHHGDWLEMHSGCLRVQY